MSEKSRTCAPACDAGETCAIGPEAVHDDMQLRIVRSRSAVKLGTQTIGSPMARCCVRSRQRTSLIARGQGERAWSRHQFSPAKKLILPRWWCPEETRFRHHAIVHLCEHLSMKSNQIAVQTRMPTSDDQQASNSSPNITRKIFLWAGSAAVHTASSTSARCFEDHGHTFTNLSHAPGWRRQKPAAQSQSTHQRDRL